MLSEKTKKNKKIKRSPIEQRKKIKRRHVDLPDGTIRYRPTPTGARFHGSNKRLRGIRGPFGSGKSVTCVMEIFRRALEMPKGKDGVRRSRWACIRNTYPMLRQTTIKTWLEWFPMTEMVYGSPITGMLELDLPDGKVSLELLFVSCDKPKDLAKLKGLELTGAWVNEAIDLPWTLVKTILGRCGRYPAKRSVPRYWSGVIMDTNPPDTDHWWFRLAEIERDPKHDFFAQPPALIRKRKGAPWMSNPLTENVENQPLGHGYWLDQVPGNTDEWIKVFLCGQYGSIMDGQPVYPEYNDDIHCAADPIEPLRGLPLLLGFDFGRTPACIICQVTPRGQFRILDELIIEADGRGMGIRIFVRSVVMPYLALHYKGMKVRAFGDPAGIAKEGDELSSFDHMAAEGLPAEPASSNNPENRIAAVTKHLITMVDGEPGLLLSPKAQMIRKGFMGAYKYQRIQVSGVEERFALKPLKNKYSHPHDALQYASLGGKDVEVIRAQTARPVVTRKWG